MNDLRKLTLMRLIDMRRQLEQVINELSGDPKYRDFVQRYESGEPTRVRQLRNYDVPAIPAEELMTMWGIVDNHDNTT